MSNCMKKIIFYIKVLKTVFVANDKWRQAPGFDRLHHKSTKIPNKNNKYTGKG